MRRIALPLALAGLLLPASHAVAGKVITARCLPVHHAGYVAAPSHLSPGLGCHEAHVLARHLIAQGQTGLEGTWECEVTGVHEDRTTWSCVRHDGKHVHIVVRPSSGDHDR